ncbi:MAG: hypothetical protein HY289_14010 [Planctomycetes bacterium]|nr:hypothetical protein [Planctomycetota bacterium]
MAGLKKKTKEKSGSPNIVLVIFLVFFVLVSIGLGIFAYYGYADQGDLRRAAKAATDAKNGEKVGKEFYKMLAYELAVGLGGKLDDKQLGQMTAHRLKFTNEPDGGDFKNEPDKEFARSLLEDLHKREKLGYVDQSGDFVDNYPTKFNDAEVAIKDLKSKAEVAIKNQQRYETLAKKLQDQVDAFQAKANQDITTHNVTQMAIVKTNNDNFKNALIEKAKLTQDLTEKQEELLKERDDHAKAMAAQARKIGVLELEMKEMRAAAGAPGGAPAGAGAGNIFPLILDISTGRPLWDSPVGRVTKVDLDLRQVTINLGSAHGVKPELTFNIFGAGINGRADKQLKGSIEIIKVIDAGTSICRITSMYDVDGHEILLNLNTRTRLQRESESAMREGDLLFNLFWGTRVAVAGYVSVTGEETNNPAEQVRQMEDFMYLLKRNGMIVDAFVDLRDGKVDGRITAKTRYLIFGDNLKTEKAKAGDEEKKDEKEPAKEGAVNAGRNDQVNASNLAMRNEAKDRGLMMISAENFATVIGYRKARSANSAEVSTFRPSLPYASSGPTGVLVLPDNRPRPDDEKKGGEMKKDN